MDSHFSYPGEESEAQTFENEFFNIFGVDRYKVALFEKKVKLKDNYYLTAGLFGDESGSAKGKIDLFWPGHMK